jgi:hypothetical protein
VDNRVLDGWEAADGSKRRNTIGEEMVSAARSGTIVVDGVRQTIRAWVTRIWRGHDWLRKAEVAAFFQPESRSSWYLASTRGEGDEPWRIRR